MKTGDTTSGMRLLGAGASFRSELIDMMATVEMLSDLDARELATLAAQLQAFEAAPGCVIFREGDAGNYMAWLVSGRVRTFKESDADKAAEVSVEGRGRSIGEMALIDGEPRSATCAAAETSVLLLLTKQGFQDLSARHAALALKLLMRITRLMSRRLRLTSGRLVDLLDN